MATGTDRQIFRTTLAWAALLLLCAVALGAFGAHGLKDHVEPGAIGQWRTAVEYQFYHGLALLGLAVLSDRIDAWTLRWARLCFLLGVLCFSGSLYLLSTRYLLNLQNMTPVLGPITPLGGLFYIAGWVLLLITALRAGDDR